MFDKPEVCSQCGGKCCKRFPGAYYPQDFTLPLGDSLEAAFKGKLVAIDWWEGDPRDVVKGKRLDRAYFIRPRVKKSAKLFDASWGGECIHLTDTGCSLPTDSRPTGCKMLEPAAGGVGCIRHHTQGNHNDKQEACLKWLPHTDIIVRASQRAGG